MLRVYKWYILTCFIHTCTCVSPWWWTLARRAESANAEPLRESVDFSDLLENSDEREEDRKKKLVSLFNVTVHACIVHVHVHEYSAQLMLECFAVHNIYNCFILVSYYTLSLPFLSLPPSPSSPSLSLPPLPLSLPSQEFSPQLCPRERYSILSMGQLHHRCLARSLGGRSFLVHRCHQELSSKWRDVSCECLNSLLQKA